ncbi:MAG: glycosyltransferase [Roseiarcus sp.]
MTAIITTYNQENYIAEAIDSILSQDYRPLEIIVVDDGSTDATAEIAAQYSKHGVRVRSQRNTGPSSAMNAGIKMATGDILVIQSGDDVALPGRISNQVNVIYSGRAEIITSIPLLIDGSSAVLHKSIFPVFSVDGGTMQPIAILRRLFYGGNFICAPSVTMTRSATSIIGPFHEGLLQLQDYHYWLRAASLGYAFHIDSAPMIKYRVHGGNLSMRGNTSESAESERLYILRRFSDFITTDVLQSLLSTSDFASCGIDAPKDVILPQLYLKHGLPSVRRIGFELIIDLLASERGRALLARHFALSPAAAWDILPDDPTAGLATSQMGLERRKKRLIEQIAAYWQRFKCRRLELR